MFESDEDLIRRKQREKAVAAAWRGFRQSLTRKERKQLKKLPSANPMPKAIIVTHNRSTDPFEAGFRQGSPT